jgi:hypothetical protein
MIEGGDPIKNSWNIDQLRRFYAKKAMFIVGANVIRKSIDLIKGNIHHQQLLLPGLFSQLG